jgi:hypothetical protein
MRTGFNADCSKIDIDGKGSLDSQTVVKSVQSSESFTYDDVRATLKECNVDASGRVELEDYVEVCLTCADLLIKPVGIKIKRREIARHL